MRTKAFYFLLALVLLTSCGSEDIIPNEEVYTIEDGQINFSGEPIVLNGVNALHTFGLENLELMNNWNVKIVREFIGNLREQPSTGTAIQDSQGKWLHPLKEIVARNRAAGIVTILCPFGWVNEQGIQSLFTGLNPSEQDFYASYKSSIQEIARHFAGETDVWIEVWNEPYHWNNENSYNHELWLEDMRDMLSNLRSVDGFDNIIVIPGNEQGQSEESILSYGQSLMNEDQNIIFDLHAYEKWLTNTSMSLISERLTMLRDRNLPFLFGEIGVRNVGELMEPSAFLSLAQDQKISTLAWLWKKEANDNNALLNENGTANNLSNNNWGALFKSFLERP